MYKFEINAVQMKYLREFFDNYKDDKVELKLADASNRVKTIYDLETELSKNEAEKYLKDLFKTNSKYGAALYYTLHVK
jgi:flavoprotein